MSFSKYRAPSCAHSSHPVTPRIGILALQGGVAEHARMMEWLGAEVVLVRKAEHIVWDPRRLAGTASQGGSASHDKSSPREGVVPPEDEPPLEDEPPQVDVSQQIDVSPHLGGHVPGPGIAAIKGPPPLDGLILPGGESSTIDRLLRRFQMAQPLAEAIRAGLPTLATCAGLILLAREVIDPAPGQKSLAVLDISVRRNAFGRQVDSADEIVHTAYGPVAAAFIRAPAVERVGPGINVIARRDHADGSDRLESCSRVQPHSQPLTQGPIVGVDTATVIGVSFHPELTGDDTVHRELLRRATGH
ncbi:pyridoxal 5'-phosphate synthase glutaminase subunit PdxT [Devriesea agamarum]|uniref:pyridoxal 5'-phosphate synthase glutaminase subunit PdxT n=1 Tax=Devriesea agamarum TaxID=472569 RepID=UPI00071D68E9|nr:pyridoxal 5'-phosphate synthase glutaminase subunit PdxT [Devriesea agamarum]